jgi:acyl carrier protein
VNNDELKALILHEVANIAPEADPNQIDPTADLSEQVDLDSMDLLNLMIAIHAATGVDIPEADYSKMATLNSAIAYLQTRISG